MSSLVILLVLECGSIFVAARLQFAMASDGRFSSARAGRLVFPRPRVFGINFVVLETLH